MSVKRLLSLKLLGPIELHMAEISLYRLLTDVVMEGEAHAMEIGRLVVGDNGITGHNFACDIAG
jgi:hypothetical protein